MIRLERLRVVTVRAAGGRYDLEVERNGTTQRAIAYAALIPRPEVGDIVVCNTTAVDLGLGTGGFHLVVAVEGRAGTIGDGGHAMKARYLPHQLAVDAVEEAEAARIDDPAGLQGARIVVCPLHSLIAPTAIAIRASAPGTRIAYVMTDHAALALPLSDLVAQLREDGILDVTLTCGQAFGGDLEAISVSSALLAARHVAGADAILVAMGPGNLGTASRYGFAALGLVEAINATSALQGEASLCARISFADPRSRHHGLSHHTRTMVEVAAGAVRLPLPRLDADRHRVLTEALAGIPDAEPIWVDVDPVRDALTSRSSVLRSMGRSITEDEAFFLAGAAAGLDALR